MHELGIMQNIVDTIEGYARQKSIRKIRKVILEVGAMSGVIPDALEFSFGFCTKQTVLEGAMLEIIKIKAVGRCKSCGGNFDLLTDCFSCQNCGAADWEMISGRELMIKGLEVM